MSDVVIQICDFKTRSKSANKLIDKDSMVKVISSPSFKKDLDMGRILGLATHKSRYELDNPKIPMEDQILTSPYLANCARKIWIDESRDCLMGEFDLLDTPYGKLIRDMLKKGIMIPVSMSVSATADNDKYYIEELLGVDFTERPDLNAKIDRVNFSNIARSTPKDVEYLRNGKHYMSFSTMLSKKNCRINFSNEYVIGKPTLGNSYKIGIRRESMSQSNIPPVAPYVEANKTNVVKLQPVENTAVPSDTAVITNLNADIVGVQSACITPTISFSKYKLFNSLGINEHTDLQTSLDEIHDGIPKDEQMTWEELKTFPSKMLAISKETFKNNFSFLDIVKEWQMPPAKVFEKRINEVLQVCRSKDQKWISNNLNHLKNHFDEYMLTWINESINGSSDKKFDISMGLRLPKFNVNSKNMMRLNRSIGRMKEQLKTVGFISKQLQEELNTSYQAIENDIYQYIDTKLGSSKSFKETSETEVTENAK